MSHHDTAAKIRRENEEKQLIRGFFNNERGLVVIEVGANDPTSFTSQSHHLETELGWKAVLVEPNPDLAGQARRSRPDAAVFECACVSSDDIGELSFFIPVTSEGEIHSHAAIAKNIDDHHYADHRVLKVMSKTLNAIIAESGVPRIDLLSIDVEGAEMDVLKGLDLRKHRPRMILLEDKHVYLDKHRFLRAHGYVLARRTGQNCWYLPEGGPLPALPLGARFSLWRRLYLSIWLKKAKLALRKRSLEPFLRF
jgi:FkbM family methyltransferase